MCVLCVCAAGEVEGEDSMLGAEGKRKRRLRGARGEGNWIGIRLVLTRSFKLWSF